MTFTTFIPTFGNKNHDIKLFAHLDNGEKKELKHLKNDIYYFCVNRIKHFVKVTGSIYNKQFEIIC